MGAKFCFFTDASLLAPQTGEQAFGPILSTSPSAVSGKDSFRVTDLHTTTGNAPAPAIAICNGRVRIQSIDADVLTLILKPDAPPPFDFPFVSYFVYKGLLASEFFNGAFDPTDPASADILLKDGSSTGNDLLAAVLVAWKSGPNRNLFGSTPNVRALGLDLTATKDASRYGDDRPIDSLFYGRPPGSEPVFDPIPVKAGDTLGIFDGEFGLDIVVERIGLAPALELTRTLAWSVRADPLTTAGLADDEAFFMPWHDRDQVLGFVDPCAFWGAFFDLGLDASKALPKVDGDDIYDTVLRGAHDDAPDGAFRNRNKAYLDIRDEHGHSLNYYQAASVGRTIRLALGNAAFDPAGVDYYDSGWPSFAINTPLADHPSAGPDWALIRLALPRTTYSNPVFYVSAGLEEPGAFSGKPRSMKKRRRHSTGGGVDDPFLEAAAFATPLVKVGADWRYLASYQKVSHFKTAAPVVAAGVILEPVPKASLDYVLPIPGGHVFPIVTTRETTLSDKVDDEAELMGPETLLKVYADKVYVPLASGSSLGFFARPGIARDGSNIYLFLFPTARRLVRGLERTRDGFRSEPSAPSLQVLRRFLPEFLDAPRRAFVRTNIDPNQSAITPAGTNLDVVHERRPGIARRPGEVGSDLLVVAMRRIDYEPVVAPDPQHVVVPGSAVLSLAPFGPFSDPGGRGYVEATATLSRLEVTTSGKIVRKETQPFPTLYAHADL